MILIMIRVVIIIVFDDDDDDDDDDSVDSDDSEDNDDVLIMSSDKNARLKSVCNYELYTLNTHSINPSIYSFFHIISSFTERIIIVGKKRSIDIE